MTVRPRKPYSHHRSGAGPRRRNASATCLANSCTRAQLDRLVTSTAQVLKALTTQTGTDLRAAFEQHRNDAASRRHPDRRPATSVHSRAPYRRLAQYTASTRHAPAFRTGGARSDRESRQAGDSPVQRLRTLRRRERAMACNIRIAVDKPKFGQPDRFLLGSFSGGGRSSVAALVARAAPAAHSFPEKCSSAQEGPIASVSQRNRCCRRLIARAEAILNRALPSPIIR